MNRGMKFIAGFAVIAAILLTLSVAPAAWTQARGGSLRSTLWVPSAYSINFGIPGEANSPSLTRSADNELSLTIGSLRLGPARGLVLEGATNDAFETTLDAQDPAADGSTLLPADVTGVANVGFVTDVLMCGDNANNGTIYMSPVTGFASGQFYVDAATLLYNIAGTGCDVQDDGTEGTADEIMFVDNAFKVLGMQCTVSGSGGNGVVLNLRSATANLTPDITIPIPTGETTGVTNTATTTDVAANATFALRAITTEDLSGTAVWCMAKILLVP